MTDRDTFDCTDIQALLSGLLDDTIAPQGRHRVERHLTGCAACRDLVSDAERNDALVAAALAPGRERLPAGFEAAVLARTTRSDRRSGGGWTAWLGWLAAAAALLLAATLWVMDGGRNGGRTVPPANEPQVRPASTWVPVGGAELLAGPGDGGWVRTDPPRQATAVRAASPSPQPALVKSGLPRPMTEALESTSLLLAMLTDGDDQSFADVENVRRVTEFEDLLPRLAEARQTLPAEDRPAVFAAESMLYRIARGPLSLDEVRELRSTIARLKLPSRLDEITGRGAKAVSI